MGTYQADRLRLGQKLTDAEATLRDLQADLDRTSPTAPGHAEARWLRDRQREECRLIRAEIERNENRKHNAVNRAIATLLRQADPDLFARLALAAEQQVDPDGAQ